MSPKKRKKASKPKKKTCGDFGGIAANGKPCTRRAGWGTKTQTGPCRDHAKEADAKMQASKKKFMEEYARGTVSMGAAARLAGVDHSTIWRWRQLDLDFDKAVVDLRDEIDEIRTDMVEESMFKQLVEGKATPVDRIFWLTNRAPTRWKNRQTLEHTGKDGTPLSVTVYIPDNGRDTSAGVS